MKIKTWFHWLGALVFAQVILPATTALAAEPTPVAEGDSPITSRAVGLGMAAAFTIAVSVIGAGYAVGRIGSAAMGAAAEKPELLTRSLILVALAEGLAVLGFAIAMMLLQKI